MTSRRSNINRTATQRAALWEAMVLSEHQERMPVKVKVLHLGSLHGVVELDHLLPFLLEHLPLLKMELGVLREPLVH